MTTRVTVVHSLGDNDHYDLNASDAEVHALHLMLFAAWQAGDTSVQVDANNGTFVVDLTDVTAIRTEALR
jgi:hypothetical protein